MNLHTQTQNQLTRRYMHVAFFLVLAVILFMTPEAFAQGGGGAGGKVKDFFDSVIDILDIASVAIVTIAFMFCGYQVAFAHKRVSDVAPILIGALLIGGAVQFAKMLLSK